MRLTRRPLSCGDGGDADAEVDGVGDEALLARLDRLDQALAGEGAALDQRQAAAVEGQPGVVGQPHGAQRLRHAARRAPQRHALDGDVVLDDRHHRRLVAADRDRLFQLVLEQLAEIAARGAASTAAIASSTAIGRGAAVVAGMPARRRRHRPAAPPATPPASRRAVARRNRRRRRPPRRFRSSSRPRIVMSSDVDPPRSASARCAVLKPSSSSACDRHHARRGCPRTDRRRCRR